MLVVVLAIRLVISNRVRSGQEVKWRGKLSVIGSNKSERCEGMKKGCVKFDRDRVSSKSVEEKPNS